jgi:hypothetical protein
MRRLAFACFLAAGCGGTSYQAPTAATASTEGAAEAQVMAEAAPPPRRSWWHRSAPAPAAEEAPALGWHVGGGAPVQPPPQPEERPGLGTVFGEDRVSRVHDVSFERATPRPFAVATVHYNDAAGVQAMAAHQARLVSTEDAPVAVQGGVALSVMGEDGQALEALSLGGRVHVVGEVGRRYTVVLRNHTPRRYEAVMSVDGLDVVDGKTASFDKRGYVIEPYGTLVVDGFRRSNDVVAAFRFGSVAGSYAARTGSDRNVGVIGLALFGELGAAAWSEADDRELERRLAADPFEGSRFAQPPPL